MIVKLDSEVELEKLKTTDEDEKALNGQSRALVGTVEIHDLKTDRRRLLKNLNFGMSSGRSTYRLEETVKEDVEATMKLMSEWIDRAETEEKKIMSIVKVDENGEVELEAVEPEHVTEVMVPIAATGENLATTTTNMFPMTVSFSQFATFDMSI